MTAKTQVGCGVSAVKQLHTGMAGRACCGVAGRGISQRCFTRLTLTLLVGAAAWFRGCTAGGCVSGLTLGRAGWLIAIKEPSHRFQGQQLTLWPTPFNYLVGLAMLLQPGPAVFEKALPIAHVRLAALAVGDPFHALWA